MSMMCISLKRLRTTRPFDSVHFSRVRQRWPELVFCLLGMALSAVFMAPQAQAESGSTIGAELVRMVGSGCVMLNDEQGIPLLAHQAYWHLIPASLVKIYTALVVLKQLGSEYRFRTDFYQDGKENLAIKGWGDPFLISEDILGIAARLKAAGISDINAIYLDVSAFASDLEIPGRSQSLNPYDALNGALIVNFNTLNVGRDPNGRVYSAEPQTPLTPLAEKKGRQLPDGSEQRLSLSSQDTESRQYVGELFKAIFETSGITVAQSDFSSVTVDERWRLLYRHYGSRPFDDILRGLLRYSNNYIANQLFLVTGAEIKGYPATIEKSRQVFQEFLNTHFGRNGETATIDEASGLSTHNRMTGRLLMAILEDFRPYQDLLDEKNGIRLKSGTLTGVYNYAGYFKTETGIRPFVILLNQSGNSRDRILTLLAAYSRQMS